jgi:hypothetical protein
LLGQVPYRRLSRASSSLFSISNFDVLGWSFFLEMKGLYFLLFLPIVHLQAVMELHQNTVELSMKK